MSARRFRSPQQAGALVVEFAIVVGVFLLFACAVMELARAIYLINMLQEVTRRAGNAAAVTDFSDGAALDAVRRAAVLDAAGGRLALGAPITDAHVRIDYLSLGLDASGGMTFDAITAGNLPANPARNLLNCTRDPHGGACIRVVRARICDPADAAHCTPVRYQPILPMTSLAFALPMATTLVPAESLGFVPGMAP